MPIKPLRDCLKTAPSSVRRDYDKATTDRLIELLLDCDLKLHSERGDSSRVDAYRSVMWFVNAALTRRGVAPRSRTPLGEVPVTAKNMVQEVRKADAPYIDLQWLGFQYPELAPKRWHGIKLLAATAPGIVKSDSDSNATDSGEITFACLDPRETIDEAFGAADQVINRSLGIARKCIAFKLSTATQAEMRWLCSRNTREFLRDLAEMERNLRRDMRLQGIKQLTDEMIDNRIAVIRAWKLVGGGTNWQATADQLAKATGRTVTRQAIRDIITRLGEQRIVRRRRKKTKKVKPILSST